MWNVPYVVALTDPVRQSMSLFEAMIMQAVGLTGESILLFTFPDGHSAIMSTVTRFVMFDGAGLVALLLAGFLVRKQMPGIIVSGCGT